VLFVCEGGAEHLILNKLDQAGYLLCPSENIRGFSDVRKAAAIENEYLQMDYDKELIIVRVVDSIKEQFKLGPLYRERYPVFSILTRPEIEMLVVLNEGKLAEYNKVKSQIKPSLFCSNTLGLKDIKRPSYLEDYWNEENLRQAILEYKRVSGIKPGELCLADLLNRDV